MAEEHSGLSSEIHACPPLFSQAEKLRVQSRPLRHWALTRTHITNPLLYSNLLQAPLHYCLARPGAVRTDRLSSGFKFLQPQNHQWLVLASWSVHPSCLAVDSH